MLYLGEFDVPKRFPEAPCPCCWPRHPKFRRGGKVAWFIEEKVVRLIGPDCFRALNPEGHEEALRRYREEQTRKRNIAYLLRNPQIIPQARHAIRSNLAIAMAVDAMRGALMQALRAHNIHLWNHVRSGVLSRDVTREVISVGRDGRQSRRRVANREQYATIRGHVLLDPTLDAFGPRLREAEQLLASIDFGEEHERRVHAATNVEHSAWAATLSDGIGKAVRVTEELDEARRLFWPETVSTLRTWGQLPGADCQVFMRWEDGELVVGQTEDDCTVLGREAALEGAIERIPDLADIEP